MLKYFSNSFRIIFFRNENAANLSKSVMSSVTPDFHVLRSKCENFTHIDLVLPIFEHLYPQA